MIVLHKTNVLGVVCEINDISNNACASKPMSLGYFKGIFRPRLHVDTCLIKPDFFFFLFLLLLLFIIWFSRKFLRTRVGGGNKSKMMITSVREIILT